MKLCTEQNDFSYLCVTSERNGFKNENIKKHIKIRIKH